jgi:rhodanese-related sulfurtransferase
MNYISAKDWIEKYSKDVQYHLIDIREPYEIADSKLTCECIPMDELMASPNRLDCTVNNVIMCNSGKRAEALVNILETDFQLKNMSVLEGGYVSMAEII